jgi:tetratricopeptide (TPR) repeat protein
MCVTEQLIDKLQRNYFAGRDLARSIPSLDADTAAVIVAETLEADYCWSVLVDGVKNQRQISIDPLNDWSRATTAYFFFRLMEVAKRKGDKEHQEEWREIGASLLDEIVRSPTASPLLWYEDIYLDVSQEMRARGEREALAFLKQSLAHNLHYNEGNNAPMILRDLAETYLWLGDLDEGLRVLTGLLRNDPSDIWVYNSMTITFDQFGLPEIGKEAATRGLELVEQTGDPERLRGQLGDSLDNLEQGTHQNREAEVDPQVLTDLRAALALDFDSGAHQSLETLCRALVPDLDQIPVKEPPPPPDLPPPEEYGPLPERRRPAASTNKLGRNDPCWCGSGKKYKHCHLRADQRRG